MIKEAIVSVLVAGAGGTAVYMADTRYIKIAAYEQSVNQQRKWQLQDRISEIRGKASYENRDLTPYEKQQIQQLESQIRRLGG